MKRHTKKLLKLKKGGEDRPSKRSTKHKPNRPSRRVLKPSSPAAYPVENKDFEIGDIYKLATEQTVVGIRNGQIVPIDKMSYPSDSPNTEIFIAPALREGIKSKTEKMKKMMQTTKNPSKLKQFKNRIKTSKFSPNFYTINRNSGNSHETGYTFTNDENRKESIKKNKLSEPKKTLKSRPSSSSSQGSADYELTYGSTRH